MLVHCKAGRSRSGAVIIAFLMRYKRWTMQHAYQYVLNRRPAVSPNIGFMSALMKLEKRLGLSQTEEEGCMAKEEGMGST